MSNDKKDPDCSHSDFRVFAHRGSSGTCPENTLEAFQAAVEDGATWIELDVFLVENRLLVIHNDTIDETTNGKGRLVDLGVEKIRRFQTKNGEPVPFLEEVFEALMRHDKHQELGVNIEIKGKNPESANAVSLFVERLASQGWRYNQLLVSSFTHTHLEALERINPNIPIGFLLDGPPPQEFFSKTAVKKAKSINLSTKDCNKSTIETIQNQGKRVFVFTVNDETTLRQMLALGIDGIFTDYPKKMINLLSGQ